MGYTHIKKTGRLLLLTLSIGFIFSCKNDKVEPKEEIPEDVGIDKTKSYLDESESENKLRDSVWYYYKLLSLWEGSVPPSEFKKIDEAGYLRKEYTQYFSKAEDVLSFLMGRTELKQTATKNYDWYSYIDGRTSYTPTMTRFGFEAFYLQNASSGDDNAYLYIRYVEKGSSAYAAGLRRGDRILSINNNTAIDYNTGYNFVNQAINNEEITLIVEKIGEGTPLTVNNLSPLRSYNVIQKDSIYYHDKTVGYLAFNDFGDVGTSQRPTNLRNDFNTIFEKFQNANVSKLVVDLRNNGGGYVETAEYLANMIIPRNADKKLMNTYKTNKYVAEMENLKSDFAPVYFKKTKDLNIDEVYFLVSSGTASASELLINVLRPHMPVKMIGTITFDQNDKPIEERTYGKPVGFFGIDIGSGLEIYVTSFQMFNATGEGNYFTGMTPNRHVREFLSFYDLGDTREAMLKDALVQISPSFSKQAQIRSTSPLRSNMKNVTGKNLSMSTNSNRPIGMFKEFKH